MYLVFPTIDLRKPEQIVKMKGRMNDGDNRHNRKLIICYYWKFHIFHILVKAGFLSDQGKRRLYAAIG